MRLRSKHWGTSVGVTFSVLGALALGAACGGGKEDESLGGAGGEVSGSGGKVDSSSGGKSSSSGGKSSSADGGSGFAGGGGDGGGGAPDDVEAFLDALPDWKNPPPAKSDESEPMTEMRELRTEAVEAWPFECDVVKHDIVERHEEILNFDSGAEYVKPGVLLAGAEFLKGNLVPIPLKRAAITLSINVPGVANASVVVKNPTTSNLQDGVAKLQAEAEKATKGSYAAQLSYEQHIVQSVEEMKFKLGVSGGFDGLFASASFSAKFENEETVEKYTVVSNLRQQMYSITFAQDALSTVRDFFDPGITLEDLQEAEKNDFLGPGNVPVFISSVTYGRMVVFSATSTSASSKTMLQSTLQASGSTWSASAELSAEQKNFMATLDIEVLSVGGNQSEVTNAIRTGNWNDLYAGADILSSVPLRYTVRSLTGNRPIAAIGDTTSYSVADCSAVEGWYETPKPEGTRFVDVSTNSQNDPVMVVTEKGGTYSPYELAGGDLVEVPGFTRSNVLDVAVDDIGNVFLYDLGGRNINRLGVGGTAWATNSGASNVDMLHFDAGAQDLILLLSATYSDNQNNILRLNWGGTFGDWIDEAQDMKTNLPPYFAAVGTGYVGRHGGQLGYRASDGGWTQYSADTDELNTVERYTAASANEVYAVRLGTGEVVKFNATSKKFDSFVGAPPGKAITLVEATSNGRLWAITSDGSLYAYSPPR